MLADEDECRGCGLCADLCPYGAIEIVETPRGMKAMMREAACKGCGVCGASCYRRAIRMSHFSDEQFVAQIRASLQSD
jgi:heterodisulfide reductase subunit A